MSDAEVQELKERLAAGERSVARSSQQLADAKATLAFESREQMLIKQKMPSAEVLKMLESTSQSKEILTRMLASP